MSSSELVYQDLEVLTSGIPGKTRKGGQSARRYERLREAAIHEFYKRVADHANKQFLENGIVALVIGGPGPSKEKFLKGGYLDYRLQKKVIETMDIDSSGEEGVRAILNKMTEMELFKQNRTLFENMPLESLK